MPPTAINEPTTAIAIINVRSVCAPCTGSGRDSKPTLSPTARRAFAFAIPNSLAISSTPLLFFCCLVALKAS